MLDIEGSESVVPAPKVRSPNKSREIASFVAIFDRNKQKLSAYYQF